MTASDGIPEATGTGRKSNEAAFMEHRRSDTNRSKLRIRGITLRTGVRLILGTAAVVRRAPHAGKRPASRVVHGAAGAEES